MSFDNSIFKLQAVTPKVIPAEGIYYDGDYNKLLRTATYLKTDILRKLKFSRDPNHETRVIIQSNLNIYSLVYPEYWIFWEAGDKIPRTLPDYVFRQRYNLV